MSHRLDVAQASARLRDAGATAGLTLLDVREPWETALGRIEVPGVSTLSIPMNEVPGRLAELMALPSILCYCHHGMRSLQVVAFLVQQGHASVYNLDGGTDAWSLHVDPALARY